MRDGLRGVGLEVRAAVPVVIAAVNGQLLAVGVDDEAVLVGVLVAGLVEAAVHGDRHALPAVEQRRVEDGPADEAIVDGLRQVHRRPRRQIVHRLPFAGVPERVRVVRA